MVHTAQYTKKIGKRVAHIPHIGLYRVGWITKLSSHVAMAGWINRLSSQGTQSYSTPCDFVALTVEDKIAHDKDSGCSEPVEIWRRKREQPHARCKTDERKHTTSHKENAAGLVIAHL